MGLERHSIFKNLPPRGLKTRALWNDVCQHEERLPTIAYRTSICKPFKPSLSRQKFHKYFNYFTTPKHRHRRVLIERMGATKPEAGLVFRLAVSLWNLCSLCLRCPPSPTTPPSPRPHTRSPAETFSIARVMPVPPSRDCVGMVEWMGGSTGWRWGRPVSVGKWSLTYFSRSWLTSLCQSFPFRIRLKRCLFKFFLASLWHLAKICHFFFVFFQLPKAKVTTTSDKCRNSRLHMETETWTWTLNWNN